MLYERWLLELWHGDYAVADEILTEDFAGHWPDREVSGRAELVDLIRSTHAMFTSLEFKLELGPIAGRRPASPPAGPASGAPRRGRCRCWATTSCASQDGRFAEYWVASWAGTP